MKEVLLLIRKWQGKSKFETPNSWSSYSFEYQKRQQ